MRTWTSAHPVRGHPARIKLAAGPSSDENVGVRDAVNGN